MKIRIHHSVKGIVLGINLKCIFFLFSRIKSVGTREVMMNETMLTIIAQVNRFIIIFFKAIFFLQMVFFTSILKCLIQI